jgi:uncharacterized membrane protein
MYPPLALFASALGLCVSIYIYIRKSAAKPLMCPRKANCDTVVRSKYAVTFGVPNELIGVGYYALIFTASAFVVFGLAVTPFLHLVLAFLAIVAFVTSLYLIYIQGFVLRAWCTWCLLSAFANTLILAAIAVG